MTVQSHTELLGQQYSPACCSTCVSMCHQADLGQPLVEQLADGIARARRSVGCGAASCALAAASVLAALAGCVQPLCVPSCRSVLPRVLRQAGSHGTACAASAAGCARGCGLHPLMVEVQGRRLQSRTRLLRLQQHSTYLGSAKQHQHVKKYRGLIRWHAQNIPGCCTT